jgi:hypothetical protein
VGRYKLRLVGWHYLTPVQAHSLGIVAFFSAAAEGYKYQQRMVTRDVYMATLAGRGCLSDDGCGFSYGPGDGPYRAVQQLDELMFS